jgi:hypothetical protein
MLSAVRTTAYSRYCCRRQAQRSATMRAATHRPRLLLEQFSLNQPTRSSSGPPSPIANPAAGAHIIDTHPNEVAVPKLAVDGQIEHRNIALAAPSCRRTRTVQTSFGFNGRFWPIRQPCSRGRAAQREWGFRRRCSSPGEADPFHLSARSRSTGRAPYPEKALSAVPALCGIATAPLRFNASRARAGNIHPSVRPRQVWALRGYSSA